MAGDFAPNEWSELEVLVDRLLDAPPDQRALLIAELSGGDAARRAELERIVEECEQKHPLLDRPVGERFASLLDDETVSLPPVLAERYRIVRELGRGGMAIVYLANDSKHDRDVAVKIVRPSLVATLGRARFLREIAIAAKLKHPHIMPLFDSGEVDGVLYYVMPYQEDQSLRERLRRDGTLPIDDTIDILSDVCDALAYAHQQGIVHRDIKPDNVLLSGRHAMVTDFGVARAVTAAAGAEVLTTAGRVVGTVAYMAPEQAYGTARVDSRVDIYAVGVMAYEMLAGERPFSGETPASQRPGHMGAAGLDLTKLRKEVPAELAALVMRCLEPDPAARYQRAVEVLAGLRRADSAGRRTRSGATAGRGLTRRQRMLWTLAATALVTALAAGLGLRQRAQSRRALVHPSASPLSIGILPVKSASPRGELDWLSRGLEIQLSSELTGATELDMRPTETIAADLANGWSLDRIALERKVDYFVRVMLSRGQRDSIVTTLELIEGGIRSVRAGNLQDLLRVENAVQVLGRRVAEHLRPMLGTRVRERQLETSTSNSAALQLRRRADHHRLTARARIDKGDLPGAELALDSARALLIQSERLEPRWTAPRLARASLSELAVLLVLVKSGALAYSNIRLVYNQGIGVLDSLLRQMPNEPVALASRGRLRWLRVMFGEPQPAESKAATDSAENDLRAAFALDTTLSRAAADLSQLLFEGGRFDDAVEFAERAYRLDAYMERAGEIIKRLAQSNFELGRDGEAAKWCQVGARKEPSNPAHIVCFLDVMAWGSGPANADSAWMYYRDLERVMRDGNVALVAYGSAAVAAVLAKAPNMPPDSAKAVLGRIRAMVDTSRRATQELRDDLFAYEAAVLFRLRDTARANERFTQFRQRNARKADVLVQRRMLRGFVSAPSLQPGGRRNGIDHSFSG